MPSSTPSSASLGPAPDRAEITSRKVVGLPERLDLADDSLPAWTERYLDLAVRGVRSAEVTAKISRHLQRFAAWITDGLGHDRLSAVTPREVSAWRDHLAAAGNRGRDGTPAPMAPTTVNNHLAHVSAPSRVPTPTPARYATAPSSTCCSAPGCAAPSWSAWTWTSWNRLAPTGCGRPRRRA